MKKFTYLLIALSSSLLLSGCGSSSQSSTQDTSEKSIKTISAYLKDPVIENLDYKCNSITGTTNNLGKFSCEENSNVSFFIGSVNLGSFTLQKDQDKLTPIKLYSLKNSDITDIRLKNFLRLTYSLDNDKNYNNGIVLQENLKKQLSNVNIDFSDTQMDLEKEIKAHSNLTLYSLANAMTPYVKELKENLGIEINYDLKEPVITSTNNITVVENEQRVMSVIASDKSKLTYSLSGNDASVFNIEALSGEISWKKQIDSDLKNKYNILVNVTDENLNSTSQNIQINVLKTISYLNEPFISEQWAILKNDSYYAQNSISQNAHINPGDVYKNYTGKGIKIAIIDNGFDANHEDLASGVINSFDLDTKTTNASNILKDKYHGTAVAGIIAARNNGLGIKGVAHEAELILLKTKRSNMSSSDYLELFNKAEEFGADIINCSWGTGLVSNIVAEKIKYLATQGRNGKGVSIVFASGNYNSDMGTDEANLVDVISVGSSQKDNDRSNYSDYGDNLDILAPGGETLGISTLDVSGENGKVQGDYINIKSGKTFIGTSAAAPIVSGIIALMLEKNPNLTRIEIENILKNTANKIGDREYVNGRNNYYGYGKVNLDLAMKAIKN